MKVRCKKKRSGGVTHDVTIGGVYEVIGIEADWYRILSDSGSPVLFDPEFFAVVERRRPAHWKTRVLDDAEYAYAPELGAPGFFEDYHDGKPGAVRAFNRYLNRYLRLTDAA